MLVVLVVGLLVSLTTTPVAANGPGPVVEVTTYPIDAWDIVIDSGVVWVCGNEILRSSDDGETWKVIAPYDPLAIYKTIDTDGEGGLWAVVNRLAEGGWTVGRELGHFDGQDWTYFSPPKDLEVVIDLEVDDDGKVWFVVIYSEVGRYDPVEDEWAFWPDQVPWPQAKPSLVSTPSGMWATGRMVVDRLQLLNFDEGSGEWAVKEKPMGTEGFSWTAQSIVYDRGLWVEFDKYDGRRFLSSHVAFLDLKAEKWTLYPAAPMPLWDIVSMTVDSDGLIWMGLDGWDYGLIVFDPSGGGRWGTANLWSSSPRQTWSLAADPDDGVWATIPQVVQLEVTSWPWRVYLPSIRKGM